MRRSTSASQAWGSMPLSLPWHQGIDRGRALRSEPANNHERRPRAMPRNARSAALFDRRMRPSSRKQMKAGQRLSSSFSKHPRHPLKQRRGLLASVH